jgi:hypothetical protein
MRRLMIIVAALVGAGFVTVPAADNRIRIYVGPVIDAEGFAEATTGVTDSIADIQRQIRRRRGWRLVATPADAEVVIHVLSRGTDVQNDGQALLPLGSGLMRRRLATGYRVIETDLIVGTHHQAFRVPEEGESPASWAQSASRLVKKMQDWIDANREAIGARRPPSNPDHPAR